MGIDIASVAETPTGLISATVDNIVPEAHDTAIVSDSSNANIAFDDDLLGMLQDRGL